MGFITNPHLIKAIGDKQVIKKEFTIKNYVGIDPQYFEPVINGMQSVVDTVQPQAQKYPAL
jgi:penicillin-binding protein 2